MNSDHWANLKTLKFRLVGHACQVCASISHLECHHIYYRQLTNCLPDDVLILCEDCHQVSHIVAKMRGLPSEGLTLELCQQLVDWYKGSGMWKRRMDRIAERGKRKLRGVKLPALRCGPAKRRAIRIKYHDLLQGGFKYSDLGEFVEFLKTLLPK